MSAGWLASGRYALYAGRQLRAPHWWLVLIIAVVIALNSHVLGRSLGNLKAAREEAELSLQVRIELAQLITALADVEAVQRASWARVDGRSDLSASLATMSAHMQEQFSELSDAFERLPDDLMQSARLARLQQLLDVRMEQLLGDSLVLPMSADGTSRFSPITAEIRRVVESMDRTESLLQVSRKHRYVEAGHTTAATIAVIIVLLLALLIALFRNMWKDIVEREGAARKLGRQARDLDEALQSKSRERQEATLLTEMSSFLQSCASVEEMARIVPPYLSALFPGCRTAIRQIGSSRSELALVASTSAASIAESIAPTACWGLRRGQVHYHRIGSHQPCCEHLKHVAGIQSLCLPMVVHGETIGLFSIVGPEDARPLDQVTELGRSIARQVSLTLANLQLRESLHQQSLLDPLTGLYNRRYMDEILGKEAAASDRFGRPVSVLMLDIDHFKHINDSWGHPAGDAVLSSVSRLAASTSRDTDWVFRYGGEELLILLTDASLADAVVRADELRRGIEELSLPDIPGDNGRVTVSIGVATYPQDGITLQDVVERADEALYRAKEYGRNRVVAASMQFGLPDEIGPSLKRA